MNALQKDAEPVQKITIVPRTMGALGYVMQVPEEREYLNTQKRTRGDAGWIPWRHVRLRRSSLIL